MPLPYAHLSLAHACAQALPLAPDNDFSVGAIVPDMRYFSGKPRDAYHISLTQLAAMVAGTTTPPSFALGYAVHLMLDEAWYDPQTLHAYQLLVPLPPLRRRLTRNVVEAAFEYFCLTQRPVRQSLVAVENTLTHAFEMVPTHIHQAVDVIIAYNQQPTLQTGIRIAGDLGVFNPARLGQMAALGEQMERPLVRATIMLLLQRASRTIYAALVRQVVDRIQHGEADFIAMRRGTI